MVTLPMGILSGTKEGRMVDMTGVYPPRDLPLLPTSTAVNLTKSDPKHSAFDANWYRKPTSYSASIGPVCTVANMSGETTYGIWKETVSGRQVLKARSDPTALSQFTFNDTQQLRTKLLNNIRSEVFDVAMVLAEMQGTVSTAVSALGQIARSMDNIFKRKPENAYYLLTGRRRDNRRPTDKFLRETAGVYLQFKYGVMPSVYDLQGACEALDINAAGSLWNNPPLLVARATVAKSSKVRSIDFGTPYDWPYAIPCLITTEYKARCDYRINAEGIRGINRFGLGLSTLPTILFERTPFSFVLNMAVPIAELIKAWGALAGVDVAGYCETKYVRVEPRGATFPGNGSNYWWIYDVEPGRTAFRMQREAFDSPPMPLPFVRNPINTGNLASVLALFTQLRKTS